MPRLFAVLFAALLPALAAFAQSADPQPPSLIPNGDFETAGSAGQPAGWPLPAHAARIVEDGNHFLRLKSPAPGTNVMVYRSVGLKPEVRALELGYKVRHEGIKRGKKAWFDGRIIMNFKHAAQGAVNPSPRAPSFNGTSMGWVARTPQFHAVRGGERPARLRRHHADGDSSQRHRCGGR